MSKRYATLLLLGSMTSGIFSMDGGGDAAGGADSGARACAARSRQDRDSFAQTMRVLRGLKHRAEQKELVFNILEQLHETVTESSKVQQSVSKALFGSDVNQDTIDALGRAGGLLRLLFGQGCAPSDVSTFVQGEGLVKTLAVVQQQAQSVYAEVCQARSGHECIHTRLESHSENITDFRDRIAAFERQLGTLESGAGAAGAGGAARRSASSSLSRDSVERMIPESVLEALRADYGQLKEQLGSENGDLLQRVLQLRRHVEGLALDRHSRALQAVDVVNLYCEMVNDEQVDQGSRAFQELRRHMEQSCRVLGWDPRDIEKSAVIRVYQESIRDNKDDVLVKIAALAVALRTSDDASAGSASPASGQQRDLSAAFGSGSK